VSVLTLRSVRKSIGSETVLDGVSLELRPGRALVVKGRSGVGKTTLAKIASLQLLPDSGHVEFLGYDTASLSELTRSSLRLLFIGYVDQEFSLLPKLTVYRNVELPLLLMGVPREERVRRVSHYLELLGIEHLSSRYPPELSGGERQRVAIARALVKKPKLLVADEPFSNLDELTISTVIEVLRDTMSELGTAILILTTDLYTDYGIGEVRFLQRGKLIHNLSSAV
jgi:putative ABC transport system ATP-binding protein